MILETLNLYVRVFTDISHRNQEVDLFGQRYSTPLVLGPIELADLVWFGAKGRITQLWRQLTKTYPFAPHQCQHAASKRSPKKRRQDSGFNSMSCETEALLESLFVALRNALQRVGRHRWHQITRGTRTGYTQRLCGSPKIHTLNIVWFSNTYTLAIRCWIRAKNKIPEFR